MLQVNEVSNSVQMEAVGLKRGLQFLLGNNCRISRIVTDRHSAIRALLRKEYPEIMHLFNCWHMTKGKNISATLIITWEFETKVLVSLYFISGVRKKLLAASKRRGVEVLEKWARATVNIFPRCVHGDLSEDERLWLDEGK